MMNRIKLEEYIKSKFKNNLFKKPRLALVSSYIRAIDVNDDIDFQTEDEFLDYIFDYLDINEEDNEIFIEEVIKILSFSVSSNNPTIVMEFENKLTLFELERYLSILFKNEFRFKNTIFKLNSKIKSDPIKKVIEASFDYTEMALNIVTTEEIKKSMGIINLRVDMLNNKVFTSNATNKKIHHDLHGYLTRESLDIKPLYVLRNSATIKNSNFSNFAPSTLLFMNLLFDVFKKLDLSVDLELLDFTNLESTNIKGVTLKGTNLLNAQEIIQRIHNGDELFKFKVNAFKIINKNGTETAFSTRFELSFEKRLCFVFEADSKESSERFELMGQIYDGILQLLNSDTTVERGLELINENLFKPKSTAMIVQEIYDQMLAVVKDVDEKIELERYFINNFSYISTRK